MTLPSEMTCYDPDGDGEMTPADYRLRAWVWRALFAYVLAAGCIVGGVVGHWAGWW